MAAGTKGAGEESTDSSDAIYLVSTRGVGTSCNTGRLEQGLIAKRITMGRVGRATWRPTDWRALTTGGSGQRPLVVYVHGNRVGPGEDMTEGLRVYRALKRQGQPRGPIRFVIWSWPSTPIPGLLRDFRVKAAYTQPAAWQFAWWLRQLPENTRLALVGYSYGARVVSGALHLLGGGRLHHLQLEAVPPDHFRIRAALVAAAYDWDWLLPHGLYHRAPHRLERMVLTTNEQDPAMRYYHLGNGRLRVHALGRGGLPQPGSLGDIAKRIKHYKVSNQVGHRHALTSYLAARQPMSRLWKELLAADTKLVSVARATTTN